MARQHDLLHVGSRRERAQQHLGVRRGQRRHPAGHGFRRLRHHVSLARPRRHRLPGGRPSLHARPRVGESVRSTRARRDGRSHAPAAHRGGCRADRQRVGLAQRQTHRLRGARRRVQRAGGVRRGRQRDALVGRGRKVSAVVARWQDTRVLERPQRRVRAHAALCGRKWTRAQGHVARTRLPLCAAVVSRQQEARIHRSGNAHPHLRPRRQGPPRNRSEP